jgi:hypothetical protein
MLKSASFRWQLQISIQKKAPIPNERVGACW